MISPELLRQYRFFGMLTESQLREIAMLTEEETYENGEVIFRAGEPANALYFLLEGSVDLEYAAAGMESAGMESASLETGLPVGEINPGEPFGISALIEPYRLTASARTTRRCRALKLDARKLRALFEQDRRVAYLFTVQAAKAAIERLHDTRVQLAAAWA